ncbi:MAG: CRISPR-associated endonuclease Cas2 [Parabacteroides sp.]|nr:CRISPR-associated endonuclease Cas2 [Parabacteroides sp.]
MMVLITYDVETVSETGKKRLRKVAKECINYGQRVQNSVFECVLSEAQFILLKSKLKTIIDGELDSIRFYFLGNNWQRRIETIGKVTSFDISSDLII